MKLKRYYFYLVAALALLIVGLIFVYAGSAKGLKLASIFEQGNRSSHTIVLSKGGFSPGNLTIKKGDWVTFTTTAGQQFWPASDPHPTHSIYPDFDPKRPVDPGKSWSFQFEKEGTFPYHDHFIPSLGGTIVVGHASEIGENCAEDTQNQYLCWSKMIDESLRNNGLNSAFSLVENLYQTQPAFAGDCHLFLHKLGQAAYEEFADKQDIALTSASAYCGYGFYHGFMESLLMQSNNYSKALEFCQKVSAEMSQSLSDACYHGVGHGAMAVGTIDQATWGKPDSLVSKALAICNKVADSSVNVARCASGSFMEISSYLSGSQYGLSADAKNPLKICQAQTAEDIKTTCYAQMYPVLQAVSRGSVPAAIKYIEAIPEDNYAEESVETLLGSMAGINSDQSKNVQACSAAQKRLQAKCISGIALSFMLNGTPNEQYKQAAAFCSTGGLTGIERDSCYDLIVNESKNTYSGSQLQNACQSLPSYYQKKCL
ncbi:MAG: hypothetical protein WDN47_00400 [Candidatus Doudnabacteria bacterium]